MLVISSSDSEPWEIHHRNVRRAANVGACPTPQPLSKGNETHWVGYFDGKLLPVIVEIVFPRTFFCLLEPVEIAKIIFAQAPVLISTAKLFPGVQRELSAICN